MCAPLPPARQVFGILAEKGGSNKQENTRLAVKSLLIRECVYDSMAEALEHESWRVSAEIKRWNWAQEMRRNCDEEEKFRSNMRFGVSGVLGW